LTNTTLINKNSVVKLCIDMGTDSTDLIIGDVEYIKEEAHTKGNIAVEKKKINEKTMTLRMIVPPIPRVEVIKTDTSLSN
jgi:hypothetical protein